MVDIPPVPPSGIRAQSIQAPVLYPFCDCGATLNDECSHCIHNQLRPLSLRCIARSSNALACLGINRDGTSDSEISMSLQLGTN